MTKKKESDKLQPLGLKVSVAMLKEIDRLTLLNYPESKNRNELVRDLLREALTARGVKL